MATDNYIILITGGNSGVGFELATQLLSDPSKHVILGCRSLEKGKTAVQDLQSRGLPGTVELLELDVTSDKSIESAAQAIESEHRRLDALVNNAAIGWPGGSLAEGMATSFATNATAPLLTVEAFANLLFKSKESGHSPRIINVSSGAGSIGRRLDPAAGPHKLGMKSIAYCSSKCAMNYITVAQSVHYGEQGVKVFAYTPGFVVSNLGPQNKAENGARPTSEGAAPIVQMLNGEKDDDHGKFVAVSGYYPW